MTHYERALEILLDGQFHCSNEFRRAYIGEVRSRINDLTKGRYKGVIYNIEKSWCDMNHYHEGKRPKMYQLIDVHHTPNSAQPAPLSPKNDITPIQPHLLQYQGFYER